MPSGSVTQPIAAALTCPPLPVYSLHKRRNNQPTLLCLFFLLLTSGPKPRNGLLALYSYTAQYQEGNPARLLQDKCKEHADVKPTLSEDRESLRLALVLVSCSSSDLFLLKVLLPARPQESIQLVCVRPINCGDRILLASDLFCVGVTTFQNPICCCKSCMEKAPWRGRGRAKPHPQSWDT